MKDAGVEAVDGEDCRVLDLGLMSELQKSLKDKGWAARVWVRPNYQPARLVLTRPGWELAVKIDKVEFAPTLPDATWQPPAEVAEGTSGGRRAGEREDVLTLDAPRFRQLMQAIVK